MHYLNIDFHATLSLTSIPNLFFDLYMPKANGEFLKVYLYLYRWNSDAAHNITLNDIADTLFMTESDVLRALKYWQSNGLLALTFEGRTLTGITLLPITASTSGSTAALRVPAAGNACTLTAQAAGDTCILTTQTSGSTDTLALTAAAPSASELSKSALAQAAATSAPQKSADADAYVLHESDAGYGQIQPDYTKPQYTMKQISEFADNHDGQQLFFIIQQYIGHPLSQTEVNTVVFFHEKLGFSTDLIEYLFEYCVSNNHRSIHYIEKVAISWAEAGIDTVSKAKKRETLYSKTHYAVLRAFGITGRQPVQSEVDYINRWTDTYCFSSPMIIEACNRTMAALHKPNFEYTDGILKNWFDKKVVNLNDIKALDKAYAQKKAAESKDSDNTQRGSTPQKRPGKSPAPVNRFNNFNQRTYNYQELEQKLARKIQTGGEPR